ncbi:MAG: cation diffusion facilitator family transporter [Nitrospinae bacterium]|nr:cation diffusion facilitator family transporter [Nitrospinota bacterium]
MSAHDGSVKVILFALGANFGIALSKLGGALYTGSASLVAEAIHSFVDCANQLLLLWGGKVSKKAPDATHQLGYGREAFFWSFMVAIFLFTLGGIFSIYEGVHKLHGEEGLESPGVALAILLFGMALEGVSFTACLKEVKERNRFGSYWAWFRKTTDADLLVIFTEDLAAMVGLTMAALCVSAAWYTGDPFWDALGSILIGTLLVVMAALLGSEIKSLIIGEAPSRDLRAEVEAALATRLPGAKVLNLIALMTGPGEVMVSYKIDPGPVGTAAELIAAINDVEADVRRRAPEVRWQFVEPDTEA